MARRLWALRIRLTLIVLLLMAVAQGALGIGTTWFNAWAVIQRAFGRPSNIESSWINIKAGPVAEGVLVIAIGAFVAWGLVALMRKAKLL